MKKLLTVLMVLTLASCSLPGPRFGNTVTPRDWSKFETPPAGTPVMMKVFGLYGRFNKVRTIDIPGTWKDADHRYFVEFPIWRDLDNVVRIEIHFRGEVIAAKDFDPPTSFSKGDFAGWQRLK